jgi:hypothetical protein
MGMFNGIGTLFYGCSEELRDKTYVATEWFTFIYLPIIPLGSVRLRDGARSHIALGPYSRRTLQYEIVGPVPLHWRQIAKTAFLSWALVGAVVISLFAAYRLAEIGLLGKIVFFTAALFGLAFLTSLLHWFSGSWPASYGKVVFLSIHRGASRGTNLRRRGGRL